MIVIVCHFEFFCAKFMLNVLYAMIWRDVRNLSAQHFFMELTGQSWETF